ncbi:MAG: hypothetical protein WBB82_17625 [Limnothrix sp.]
MNEKMDSESLIEKTISAHKELLESLQKCKEKGINTVDLFSTYHYVPDKFLKKLLAKFSGFVSDTKPSDKEKQDAGYLLEQIAILSFGSLQGWNNLKSYQSAGAQYDLLMSGSSPEWDTIFSLLNLEGLPKGFLLEAKATQSPISDSQISRLSSLVSHNFEKTVGVGIFFSINSISGFPKKIGERHRKASDGFLKQIIFYCKTGIPIIVFDKDDILQLDKKGSLLKILDRKIREIEEMTGTKIEVEDPEIIDIPNKFSEVLKCLKRV